MLQPTDMGRQAAAPPALQTDAIALRRAAKCEPGVMAGYSVPLSHCSLRLCSRRVAPSNRP